MLRSIRSVIESVIGHIALAVCDDGAAVVLWIMSGRQFELAEASLVERTIQRELWRAPLPSAFRAREAFLLVRFRHRGRVGFGHVWVSPTLTISSAQQFVHGGENNFPQMYAHQVVEQKRRLLDHYGLDLLKPQTRRCLVGPVVAPMLCLEFCFCQLFNYIVILMQCNAMPRSMIPIQTIEMRLPSDSPL